MKDISILVIVLIAFFIFTINPDLSFGQLPNGGEESEFNLNGRWTMNGGVEVQIIQITRDGSQVTSKFIEPAECADQTDDSDFTGTIQGSTLEGTATVCGEEDGKEIFRAEKIELTINEDGTGLTGTWHDSATGKDEHISYVKMIEECTPEEEEKAQETYNTLLEAIDFARSHNLKETYTRFEHWLGGSGDDKPLDVSWIRDSKSVQNAEKVNYKLIETNVKNEGKGNSLLKQIKFLDSFDTMGMGTQGYFRDYWERSIGIGTELGNREVDLALSVGGTTLTSTAEFVIEFHDDTYTIIGSVTHTIADKFNFNERQTFPIPIPPFYIKADDLNLLEKCIGDRAQKSKPFDQNVSWTVKLKSSGKKIGTSWSEPVLTPDK